MTTVEPEMDAQSDGAPLGATPMDPPDSEIVRRVLERTAEAETALAALLADSPPTSADGVDPSLELVHDYRVALRRLRSILRLLAPSYGKKKMRKLADSIRDAATLTGDLRDEEVLRETLGELKPTNGEDRGPLARWMQGRARRERGQRARVVKTIRAHANDGEGVTEALRAVRTRLAGPPKHVHTDADLARIGLERAYDKVRDRADADGVREARSAAMHALRIGFKQLRYTAETVGGLAPETGFEERVAEIAAKQQKHLGKLHDLDEALIRMDRARGLDGSARHKVLGELEKQRRKTGHKCLRELDGAMPELKQLLGPALESDTSGGDGSAGDGTTGADQSRSKSVAIP
ncbi:MAG: CHAD domain-containing protein [Polyangiaceae bacterium]|nr:CHAD domain-containing protein [Polyangiaceae bacterium]